MRKHFIGLALAIWILAGATCGGTGFFALMAFEPPHPDWMAPVEPIPGHPEAQRTKPLGERDYYVWTSPEESQCTLEVVGAGGNSLGRATGTRCSLTLHAHAGDVWMIHATSSAPNAQENMAEDPKLLRAPFSYGAMLGALMFVVGAIVAVWALLGKPRSA